MNNLPYRQRLSTKISLSFLVSIILIVYISSSLIYFKSYDMLVKNVGKKALKIAEYSAESIDVEELNKLETVQDMNKSYFKKLESKLNTIRGISGVNYIYVLRKNESGNYSYIIESTDNKNGKIAKLGEIENTNYPGFDDVMLGKVYIDNKILQDKYGAFLSAYYPLKDKNGQILSFIGVDYNASDEYKEFQNLKITIFVISLIISIFAMIFGYILARGISKPITKLTKLADEIASYNLNSADVNIKSNSEIGLLSNSFNKMCENIKFLVNNIKTTSIKLNTTSELLASSSEEIVASSEEIERTVQEIYSCANNQAIETNNCVEITNDLSNKIEDMINILNSTSEYTNHMKVKNELGIKSILELSNSFKETIEATNIVGDKIEDLSDKSKSIDMIIETIKSISEQTNLLALNASIEAARAGEYGKGFCVVADEIRKLADQSSNSTEEIRKIIVEILQIINNTNDTVSNSKLAVSDTNKYLIQTTDIFNEINISADNVIAQIKLLNDDIIHIEKDKDDVIRLIQNISKQAEEASFDTEKINISSQEQTTGMEEVASSIQELNNMANSLSELIKVFRFQ